MGEYERKKPETLTACEKADPKDIAAIAELMNEAKRPVILFGGGIIASGASDKLRALLDKTKIPTSHSVMGTGVLSYGDSLNMGMIGMHGSVTSGMAMKQADLLIALGTRFSDRVATNINKFTDAKVVQVDIDAAEINKNVHIDIGVVANVADVIDSLMPLLEKKERTEWLSQIADWKHEYDNNLEYPEDRLRPWHIMKIISDNMSEDTMLATDVGQHQMWAAQYCSKVSPRSFLTSGGLGAMGYGMGASIGASFGRPGAPVVLVTGDGCFHMNCNEMATAVSNNIPLTVVLLNNGTLGMVRQWQTLFYGQRYSATNTDVRRTNFPALAEAFGAKGFHCETPAQFEAAFKESFAAKSPCLIECMIDKDEKVLPFIPAGRSFDDIILAENIGN
jgi:acetolactate synthase-1/2/3 large subunit